MWHVEFQDLFPDCILSRTDVAVDDNHMTVIALSQRTHNDMTSWNDDVEEERENLLQNVCMSHSENVCFIMRLLEEYLNQAAACAVQHTVGQSQVWINWIISLFVSVFC